MNASTSYAPNRHVGRLPRLDPACYRGLSFVHWSMALEERATGWLNGLHHARVREYLCHALGRFGMICPAYCLMPDHGHFVFLGIGAESDQKLGVAAFREAWHGELARGGRQLQRQPYDHVLRENEREHGAFDASAQYVLENPLRARLVADWKSYPFLGAVIPGYPELDPRAPDFWLRFWRVYRALVEPTGVLHP